MDSSSLPPPQNIILCWRSHMHGAGPPTYCTAKQLPSCKQKPATGMASGSALQIPFSIELSCRGGHQAGRIHLKNPQSPVLHPHITLPFWPWETSAEVPPTIMISSALRRKISNSLFHVCKEVKVALDENHSEMKLGSLCVPFPPTQL